MWHFFTYSSSYLCNASCYLTNDSRNRFLAKNYISMESFIHLLCFLGIVLRKMCTALRFSVHSAKLAYFPFLWLHNSLVWWVRTLKKIELCICITLKMLCKFYVYWVITFHFMYIWSQTSLHLWKNIDSSRSTFFQFEGAVLTLF